MYPPMDDNLDPGATCSIDPYVDLRTIPAGWSLAGLYAPRPVIPQPETIDPNAEPMPAPANSKL